MTAVNSGDVIELDDSVVSRWGPRLADLVLTISKEVYGVG
jgi:ABC-type hemin transport system substrate-binding protein